MAKKAGRADAGKRRAQIDRIGNAGAEIVRQAASLLDEEMSAGIVAARAMQKRLRSERRIDPVDFKPTLDRFQANAHAVVDQLGQQVGTMLSKKDAELALRFVDSTHELLDLLSDLVGTGAEIANQLIQANLAKRDAGRRQRSR